MLALSALSFSGYVQLSRQAALQTPSSHAPEPLVERLRALPSQRSRRSVSPVMVKELTNSNWCENVDGAKELSVVFFYANWCRNCKAVMPVFKRLEREFGGADFYKVNFKAESELSYNERVFSFPTVHFYLPGIGRVGRCVLTAKEAEPRLRAGLARFLGGSEGAPRQLQLLQELRTEVLRPIVRYKDLIGALRGLADVQALSAAPPNKAMAGLRDAVERDEVLYVV
jgi:thiol-disulfide isomerase/thioredoxin